MFPGCGEDFAMMIKNYVWPDCGDGGNDCGLSPRLDRKVRSFGTPRHPIAFAMKPLAGVGKYP
jgi:hypothetical protein